MDYPPVQPGHLQQIRELNELFLELNCQQRPDARPAVITAGARRRLVRCDPRQRRVLACLPRALFQLQIDQAATVSGISPVQDAVRCFALTALLVAFNMVRDSGFAARVLFAGSGDALVLLKRCQLSRLIDYSAQPGLVNCPLLDDERSVSRFLAAAPRSNPSPARQARILLSQAHSPVPRTPANGVPPGSALSGAN
jgi:hypothetical protein